MEQRRTRIPIALEAPEGASLTVRRGGKEHPLLPGGRPQEWTIPDDDDDDPPIVIIHRGPRRRRFPTTIRSRSRVVKLSGKTIDLDELRGEIQRSLAANRELKVRVKPTGRFARG